MGSMTGYYVTVQKMLSQVTANTLRELSQRSSDEARVSYVMSQSFAKGAFRDIQATASEGKSRADSVKFREEGNKWFGKNNHKMAIESYTRAILIAPGDLEGKDNEELVLAQANRSASLFQMKQYEDSLADIALALKYGYPSALRYKLYDRQGRCCMELDRPADALEAFENGDKSLEQSKLDEQQKSNARRAITKQIELCKLKVSGAPKPGKAEDKFGGLCQEPGFNAPSRRYPQASEAFDVKYCLEKGRHAMAVQNIKVGDTVVKEDPYVWVLDPSQYGYRCYHCFKVLTYPVGCTQCMRVRYCSETCRTSAWESYHKTECPYLPAMLMSRTGNLTSLVLRTILVTGMSKIIRYKNNPKSDQHDAQFSLFTDSKGVYMGGFVGLYGLLTHTEHRSPSELLQYCFLTLFILAILEKSGFIEKHSSEIKGDISVVLGGIILRFLQITACNGIEITEMSIGDDLTKSHPESIGLAFFPTVCLVNHSCDPVMELVFYENTCIARALRNIEEGQELTIDYGYLYYVSKKQPRQLSLKAQYFFDCSCNACTGDWGLRQHLPSARPVLKCSNCGAILPLFNPKANNLSSSEIEKGTVTCKKCHLQENTIEIADSLQRADRKAMKALEEAKRFQLLKAIPVLEEHVTFMDKYVSLPWKDYVVSTSMLKQCYRMMANRARRN
ncbi:hypothetical protein CAPTEDRAFT_90747 [Capitella teleta]|uniref:Protein-lysine N-methyltransferase SMYD4 n=1 Tax=Capitella teleta TaxID=283909 RepID=R7TKN0_CAPTE|nr:hypothetical protein CAPTEDRAFT_90747 [Capitella teleta]|eukprot:ELT91670.1 hypothetical protein CAPTEDRAFT_90747 [Capitella teleta]